MKYKIQITIDDKKLLFILAFLTLVSVVGLVVAYGTNNPQLVGHSWGEMICDSTLCANTTTSRVGIGTMSPGYKLDVQGEQKIGGTATGNLYIYNSANSLGAQIAGSSGNTLLNLNGGNVGIGKANPEVPLHVKTPTALWQDYFHNDNGGTPASYVYLSHGGGYGAHIRSYTTSDSVYALELYSLNSPIAEFYASGRTALGLLGNVGIGTANPAVKLDVAGDINVAGNLAVSGQISDSQGKKIVGSITCAWSGERWVPGASTGCPDDIYINCENGYVTNMRFGC